MFLNRLSTGLSFLNCGQICQRHRYHDALLTSKLKSGLVFACQLVKRFSITQKIFEYSKENTAACPGTVADVINFYFAPDVLYALVHFVRHFQARPSWCAQALSLCMTGGHLTFLYA